MENQTIKWRMPFAASLLLIFCFLTSHQAQVTSIDREFAGGMLEITKDTIKQNYFDPRFRGVNLDQVFNEAKEKLRTAQTRDEQMLIIAQTVLPLNDSHTHFFPPGRSAEIDYGWQIGIAGNEVFVTGVKTKTDAEAKGLKVGDKVISLDGFALNRENLIHAYYRYFVLVPATRVRFIVLRPGEEKPRVIDVQTKIVKTANVIDWEKLIFRYFRKGWDIPEKSRFVEFGDDLLIWRLPTFSTTDYHIESTMKKARGFKSLILDLRENSGGSVEIEKLLLSYFFDRDIKIGDEKTRKQTKPRLTKNRGGDTFQGKLIVLIDHNSASASEVFARIIQLEKRGTIIGDRSAGAVMTSRYYELMTGVGNVLYFGASVTVADLIMPDGRSLEGIGVTPDEVVLPTGKDLADRRDPVLAYAAKVCGIEITPEKAGSYFPIVWEK